MDLPKQKQNTESIAVENSARNLFAVYYNIIC